MCGIVGYLGPQEATPILLEGLHRLEYRGYDSAGITILGEDGKLTTVKKPGKISPGFSRSTRGAGRFLCWR